MTRSLEINRPLPQLVSPRIAALVLVALSVPASAADALAPLRLESSPDVVIANSCVQPVVETLRESVITSAGQRRPDQAWALVNAILCGQDKAAQRFVRSHMTARLLSTGMDSGDTEPTRTLVRAQDVGEMLRGGQSWGAEATPGEVERDLRVSDYVNGACVGGFTLRFVKTVWLIVGIDGGCD